MTVMAQLAIAANTLAGRLATSETGSVLKTSEA